MSLKKILISFIFIVIALQASERELQYEFNRMLESDPINLDDVKLFLSQHPEISGDPQFLLTAISPLDHNVAVVELLLQNGVRPTVATMQYIMQKIHDHMDSDESIKQKLKLILKLLMQYGGTVDHDLKITVKKRLFNRGGDRAMAFEFVRTLPQLAKIVDDVKKEIAKDEIKAFAALMTEAGSRTKSGNKNTKIAAEVYQMLGNSEKSLGN
jgi:hypothetical protein